MAKKDLTKKASPEAPVAQEATAVVNGLSVTLSEAQDLAEIAGIDFVGLTLEQLAAKLNPKQEAPEKPKKVVKTPPVVPLPANTDPIVKAAIDKANADIALAKQKVADLKEEARKRKEELKAQAEADRIARGEKSKAEKLKEKEEKAAAAAKAAEEFEKNRAALEQDAKDKEAHAVELEEIAKLAVADAKAARAEANAAKKAAGQAVPKVRKEGAARVSNRVKDMTKYETGVEYDMLDNKGNQVKATCKGTFFGKRSQATFYKFKTADGVTFKRRAYAEA